MYGKILPRFSTCFCMLDSDTALTPALGNTPSSWPHPPYEGFTPTCDSAWTIDSRIGTSAAIASARCSAVLAHKRRRPTSILTQSLQRLAAGYLLALAQRVSCRLFEVSTMLRTPLMDRKDDDEASVVEAELGCYSEWSCLTESVYS